MKFAWVRENICERMPTFPVLWLCIACICSSHYGFLDVHCIKFSCTSGVFTIFAR